MLWFRKPHDERPPQIVAAEDKLALLEERADRVAADLGDRNDRNHWAETISDLIWARAQAPRKGL